MGAEFWPRPVPAVAAILVCAVIARCGESAASEIRLDIGAQLNRSEERGSSRQLAQQPKPNVPPRKAASAKSKAPVASSPAARVYRPPDSRPRHDDEKLKQAGIHKYASRRLLLYTDISPELAKPLPPLMDRAYEAWEAYFGTLPPDRQGTDFQMTGYLMADRQRFVDTGLLPEALPGFAHGRHRGAEFWMNDQADDYYRAHLLLHEGTHCFMTIVPNVMLPFVFYMEGMAELFGTHQTDDKGRVQFGVMPGNKEQFPGLGRIRMIQDDVHKSGPRPLEEIVRLEPPEFAKNSSYAWSWALCEFLNSHPRYRDRFRRIGDHIGRATPLDDLLKLFEADGRDLREEWLLFAANLCHGYDIERTAIDFKSGKLLGGGSAATAEIAANRGWQPSGVQVESGQTYHITAKGRFVLAREPKPWESEAQGVSIRYCDGRPLGMLVGTIRSTAPPDKSPWTTMLDTIPVGRDRKIVCATTGTLYLRVNEFWSELADNSGTLTVNIQSGDGK